MSDNNHKGKEDISPSRHPKDMVRTASRIYHTLLLILHLFLLLGFGAGGRHVHFLSLPLESCFLSWGSMGLEVCDAKVYEKVTVPIYAEISNQAFS